MIKLTYPESGATPDASFSAPDGRRQIADLIIATGRQPSWAGENLEVTTR